MTDARQLTKPAVDSLDEASTDGTILIIIPASEGAFTEGPFAVIRNDVEAAKWNAAPGDRWFRDYDSDPMGLWEHAEYATKICALGEQLLSK